MSCSPPLNDPTNGRRLRRPTVDLGDWGEMSASVRRRARVLVGSALPEPLHLTAKRPPTCDTAGCAIGDNRAGEAICYSIRSCDTWRALARRRFRGGSL